MTPVFMNHAYTGLPRSPAAVAAVRELLDGMSDPDPAVHVECARRAGAAPEAARRAAASLVGASAERVQIVNSTTMAVAAALTGWLRRGDRVVTTDWDHFAIGRPLARLARDRGVVVDRIPSRADGAADVERIRDGLRGGARMLAITHACNVTGDVFDLRIAADLADEAGAALLVDAAASIGVIDIDVARDRPAFLAFGAHKRLSAFPGAAALVLGPGVELPPLVDGSVAGHETLIDLVPDGVAPIAAGTPDWLACAAFAAAANDGRPDLGALTESLTERLAGLEGWRLHGGAGAHARVPIFALTPREGSVADVARRLNEDHGIVATAGTCNAPWIHVAIGTAEEGVVRLSPGASTTEDDLERLFTALGAV